MFNRTRVTLENSSKIPCENFRQILPVPVKTNSLKYLTSLTAVTPSDIPTLRDETDFTPSH